MSSSNNQNEFNSILEENVKKLEEFKKSRITCGVIGLSGSGKSSLINALVGQEICETGVTETTIEAAGPFEKGGLSFYDLPGCGTTKFPANQYVENFKILKYDCLILVTSNRFYEEDLKLLKELAQHDKMVFVVRTKIDVAVDDGKFNVPKKTEAEILSQCAYDIEQYLGGIKTQGIFLVSSRYFSKWDFNKLILAIEGSLRGLKKSKFITEIRASNQEIIEKKKKIAGKLITWYSSASALNGLNPIIGLDISIDLGIVIKMNFEILRIFSIDEKSLEVFEGNKSLTATLLTIKNFSVRVLSKEFVFSLMKKYGPQFLGKQIAKYIPIIGQALSAGVSFGLTSYLGHLTLDEAIENLNSVLEEVKKDFEQDLNP